MKVLQINVTYGQGSTGAITAAIHRALTARGHTSLVLYGRGADSGVPGVYRVCPPWYARLQGLRAVLTGSKYGGCLLSTAAVTRFIDRTAPDVVHLQCINGNFVSQSGLVRWLRDRGIPTVLTLHGEFPYTANCSHAMDCMRWKTGCGRCPRLGEAVGSAVDCTASSWEKTRSAFAGFDRCTAVSLSPWQAERAAAAPILNDCRHVTVPNGVDGTVFRPVGEKQKGLVLHVTPRFTLRPADNKGGRYVAEAARRMPHVTFAVAGEYEWGMELPSNVKLLGPIKDREELARWYAAAEVTLLTSRRETFSLVCAESLCCGTPVAGFCAGGPESLCPPEFAAFVPFGDMEKLTAAMTHWMTCPPNRKLLAAEAGRRWGQEEMVGRYLALYREVCHEN